MVGWVVGVADGVCVGRRVGVVVGDVLLVSFNTLGSANTVGHDTRRTQSAIKVEVDAFIRIFPPVYFARDFFQIIDEIGLR